MPCSILLLAILVISLLVKASDIHSDEDNAIFCRSLSDVSENSVPNLEQYNEFTASVSLPVIDDGFITLPVPIIEPFTSCDWVKSKDSNDSTECVKSSNETVNSHVSSLSSSSPEVLKFINHDRLEHSRPRGSSFHRSENHKKDAHISIGWTQYSDDVWVPSIDMEDNCENREHMLDAMLASARHGNLEYFRFLKALLDELNNLNPQICASFAAINSNFHELDYYNPRSMIFAAVQGNCAELFLDVMNWKGITFKDLDPFSSNYSLTSSPKNEKQLKLHCPGSFPPKGRSILDDDYEVSSDEDDWDGGPQPVDETVLGRAIFHNSIEIVKLLLENGIKDRYPDKTETALHLAISGRHEMIIKLLLDFGGSDIKKINGALQNSLMIAISTDCSRIVKLLLERGVSIIHEDFNRRNVLHYAAEIGNIDILILLRDALKSLDPEVADIMVMAQDLKINMPIHLASNLETFWFFVDELGADPKMPNGQGKLSKYLKAKKIK